MDKDTCGLAIFVSPFFLAGYILSAMSGYDRMDYFYPVYCKAIAVCGLLFAFLGLCYLRKTLLRIFSHNITLWVIVSIFFGTNLFHYATKEMGMIHVYGFFLFAFLLYQLPAFLQSPTWKRSLLLGATLGWIILIRPIYLPLRIINPN